MVFNGRYAIVTGAASGMGRIYALRLAARGYGLILADINAAALDTLCDSIQDDVPVVQISIDLTAPGAVDTIAMLAEENDAAVEVLVNNAGMLLTREICGTDPSRLEAMMALHCTTPLLLCREFVPAMQERGCGYVLNISSICAWMPWPIIGMYGNTKRFIKGFSRSLRVECAGTGVSVTTAFFGAVDTPLFGFPPRMRRWMLRLGVMISPEKAVDKALRAMSSRRKSITPGLLNKLAIPVVCLMPDSLLSVLVRVYGHLFTVHSSSRELPNTQ